MNVWYSFLIAFAMYSRIPVPTVEWTKERMRYVMCFFPFVGLAEGLFLYLWLLISNGLEFSSGAAGLIGVAVPLIVTGGIHLDGFLDTMDALGSYGSREKKLEIMKDPHTGAFAVISCAGYLICYAGLLAEISQTAVLDYKMGAVLAAVCFMERAFSGLSVALFPCAKDTGLAAAFADSAEKRMVSRVLVVWLVGGTAALWFFGGAAGLFTAAGQGLVFVWYYWFSQKKFGGITGDVAGFYLQVCEMVSLWILVIGMKVIG